MNPIGISFPLAAITAMLFLLWSDSTRRRTRNRIVLFVRMAIFFGVIAAVVWNRVHYPAYFRDTAPNVLFALAIAVGILGGGYYLRRGIGRAPKKEDPLPKIFPGSRNREQSSSDE